MSKKYVPSGYQIININVLYDNAKQKYYVEESDDEKILKEILQKRTVDEFLNVKPILLRAFSEDYPFNITAIALLDGTTIKINNGNVFIGIILDNNELVVEITEN